MQKSILRRRQNLREKQLQGRGEEGGRGLTSKS